MKIILVIICAFFLLSCQKNQEEKYLQKIENDNHFDPATIDKSFAGFSNEEKVKFYTNLVTNDFINVGELDNWIMSKVKEEPILFNKVSIAELRKLYYALERSDLDQTATFFALLVFENPAGEVNKLLLSIASKILLNQSQILNDKDSINSLLSYYNQGMPYDDNQFLKAGYFSKTAVFHELNRDFFKAVVNADKALTYLDENDVKNRSVIYHNLASLYVNMKYYEKAEYYIEKAIEIVPENEIPKNTLNTLATIKMRANKLDESEKIFLNIIKDAEMSQIKPQLARGYANLGNVYRRQKRFDEAIVSINKSNELCNELGIVFGVLVNKVNKAEVYLDEKNYDEAENLLKSVELQLDKLPNAQVEMELYRLLAEVYLKKGQKSQSDKYFRDYIEIKEGLFGDQTKSIITEWELSNEREKNIVESSAMQFQIQKERNQKRLILLTLCFLLILSVLVFFLRRRKQRLVNQMLEQEKLALEFKLELKEKELLADSLKELSIMSTKDSIYTELKEIIQDLPKSHQDKFNKMMQELRSNQNQAVLDEFEERFVGVYDVFFEKLKNIADNISPTEVRICALIKLNLSTKEIAMITNRSIGTIDNARAKIRKKLNLAEDENLQSFILQLK
jgi:tetratricopeptide (TPR) repeat protein